MDRLTALLLPARLWLDTNGGAGTAFGTLILAVFALTYGLRKWAPTAKLWERAANAIPALNFDPTPAVVFLRKAWQALIPTAFAAISGALASGGSVKVALLAALAGPVSVFGHEFAKWFPWIPYTGAVHPAARAVTRQTTPDRDDDDLDPPSRPRVARLDNPVPSWEPPTATCSASFLNRWALAAAAVAVFLCACSTVTPQEKTAVSTIGDVAQQLCLLANQDQDAGVKVDDLKKLCSTEEQLYPYVEQLLAAKHAALAPPEAATKAPVLTGCAAALERGKALGCPVDEPDAGGWCSTRPPKEVDCMASKKNCLAFTRCTEVTK